MRRFAFLLTALLVFIRFSYLNEVQTIVMGGVNLRLLYIFGVPALAGVVVADGVRRAFRGRPALFCVAYMIWIALAVPFSSWKSASFWLAIYYFRTELVMLFAIAGLAVTWAECKMLMRAVACAAIVNLLSARLFANQGAGQRLGLEFGMVANANDFAAHLLFVLPFLLWVVLTSKLLLFRFLAFLGIGFGIYVILSTGSRGALVALAAATLFLLFRGTVRLRLALLLLGPILAVLLLAAVSKGNLRRLVSFSDDTHSVDQGTAESTANRKYLFWQSVKYIAAHPLFGIGPGQFADYEGRHGDARGTRGLWKASHNTFTQAGSECGVPAMLFLIAGVVSSFRLLGATWREARRRPACQDIADTAFCILLSMVGFCTAVTFLNFAYMMYFPAIAGFAIAVACAAREEFALRQADPSAVASNAVPHPWPGPPPPMLGGHRRASAGFPARNYQNGRSQPPVTGDVQFPH